MATGQKIRIPIEVTTSGLDKIKSLEDYLKQFGNIATGAKGELATLIKGGSTNLTSDMAKWVKWRTQVVTATQGAEEGLKEYQKQLNKTFEYLKSSTDVKFDKKQFKNILGDPQAIISELQLASTGVDKLTKSMQNLQSTNKIQWFEKTGQQAQVFAEKLSAIQQQALSLNLATEEGQQAFQQLSLEYNNIVTQQEKWEQTNAKSSKSLAGLFTYVLKYRIILGTIRNVWNAFTNTIKDSVSVAASAEQIYSKLNTVFDGLSSSLDSASELSKTIGVAQSTAASALSTVGDLLQAQGMGVAESLETATKWVEQFQDIIAFKDIDMSLEEFASTFMSGAAGNTRNFRQFGSIVKETAVDAELAKKGLDRLTGSELELAKMTTRAELALKQQANAIGATEREWDTVLSINRRLEEANKRLKENIGEVINSGLSPLKKEWTEIIVKLNEAIEKTKEFNSLMDGKDKGGFSSFFKKVKNYLTKENSYSASSERDSVRSAAAYSMGDDFYQAYNTNKDFYNFLLDNTGLVTTKEEIGAAMTMFNTSAKDAILLAKVAGLNISTETETYITNLEISNKAQEALNKANDELLIATEKATDTYDNLYEKIGAITGVKLNGKTFDGYLQEAIKIRNFDAQGENPSKNFVGDNTANAEDIEKALETGINSILSYALTSMQGVDVSTFGEDWELLLKGADQKTLLEAKQEAVSALYEAVYNEAVKNADENGVFRDSDQAVLDGIKAIYDKTGDELQAIADSEELAKSQEELRKSIEELFVELRTTLDLQTLADQALTTGIDIQGVNYKAETEEQAEYFAEMKHTIDSTVDSMRELGYSEDEIKEYVDLEVKTRQKAIDALKAEEVVLEDLFKEIKNDIASISNQYSGYLALSALEAQYIGTGYTSQQASVLAERDTVKQEIEGLFAQLGENVETVIIDGTEYKMSDMIENVTKYFQEKLDEIEIPDPLKSTKEAIVSKFDKENQYITDDKYYQEGLAIYGEKNTSMAQKYVEWQNELDDVKAKFTELGSTTLEYEGVLYEEEALKQMLNDRYEKEIEDLKEKETFENPWENSIKTLMGGFSPLYDLANGATSWQDAVLKIAQQLDTFEPIFELAGKLMQAVDSMLAPLKPMLEILVEFVASVANILGVLLMPIFKAIGIAVVGIEAGIGAIIDGVKWIAKKLTFGTVNLENPILNAMQRTAQSMGLDVASNSVAQGIIIMQGIAEMEYGIAQDVSDIAAENESKLSAYYEMYNNGLINLEEYRSLANSLQGIAYDRVNSYELGSYHNGSNGTVVYQGDLQITIEGTNLSAEEIAQKVKRYWEEQQRAGSSLYA